MTMEDEHNKREHEPYFLCLQRVAISDRERKREREREVGGGGGKEGTITFFTLMSQNKKKSRVILIDNGYLCCRIPHAVSEVVKSRQCGRS